MVWTWETLPRVYGPAAGIVALRQELSTARSSTRRWCGFGDSQETSPGGLGVSWLAELNFAVWKRYRLLGESLIAHCSSYGGGSPPAHWMHRAAVSGSTASATPGSEELPNGQTPNTVRVTSSANGVIFMLQPSLDTASMASTKERVWDITRPIYATLYARRYSGSSPELQWFYEPTTTSTATFFATTVASGTTSTMSLDNADGAYRSEVIGPFTVTEAAAYPQLQIRGSSAAGADVVSVRWFQTASPGGISWQTWATGGAQSTTLLASTADGGKMLNAYGPFNVISLHYGTNDAYSGAVAAATYKSNLQTLISTIRGASWLNTTTPLFLLMVEAYRSSGTAESDALYDSYVDALAQIADEDAHGKVLVINPRRELAGLGWRSTASGGTPTTYLADGTHYTAAGSQAMAQQQVAAIFSAASPASRVGISIGIGIGL